MKTSVLLPLSVLLTLCELGQTQATGCSNNHPVVTTSLGQLRGSTVQLLSGGCANAFYSVPYAQAPVGSARFQRPQPAEAWSTVRDVGGHVKIVCAQNPARRDMHESEDCLYLDIYAPGQADHAAATMPVMVYIHGGGFEHGNKNFDGTGLADKGVVVVTVNYRLGVLGFLSTQDDHMPGNFGMLDQIEALKWVRANIAAFGGDPSLVTVFGHSAGSASVSLLNLSPLASGLYKRSISQSGGAIDPRAVTHTSSGMSPRDAAILLGREVGCTQLPGPDFMTCMRSKDPFALISAQRHIRGMIQMRPVVEKVFGFLPDHPVKLLGDGKFTYRDTMRGFSSQEQGGAVHDPENDGLTVAEFNKQASSVLHTFPYLDADAYVKRLDEIYLTNVTDPMEIRSRTIAMHTDLFFIAAMVTELKLIKHSNKVSHSYLYRFDYHASFAHKQNPWVGVTHGAEMPFVSGHLPGQHTDQDTKVQDMMTSLWTYFAKYGTPTGHGHTPSGTPFWAPFYNNKPNYLLLTDQPKMMTFDTDLNVKLLALYQDILKEYEASWNYPAPIVG